MSGVRCQVSGVRILALDSRVGLSYQRMFLAARQQWPGGSFRGLVLHAHPEDERVWTSMRNTFRDSNGTSRLLALWLTYLPNRSPLAVERDTYLAAQQQGLNSPEMEERLEEIRRVPPAGRTLLGRSDPEVRPHSYFGQGLGSREALCAVGSAMQTARIRARPRGSPYWTQFDLRRALRSYFDGLIHASILRWCEPQEAWWARAVVTAVISCWSWSVSTSTSTCCCLNFCSVAPRRSYRRGPRHNSSKPPGLVWQVRTISGLMII